MATKLRARLDILPPVQRRLWDELAAVPAHFTLYGGTALALRLGHRQSEDFDFFAERDIDPDELYRSVSFLRGAQIIQQEPNTFTCLIDRRAPIKVSFFGLPHLKHIRAASVAEGNNLKVASLLDISATKVSVVQQRAQAKDYIDIDALMIQAGIDLPTQLAAARAVYGQRFAPTPTLKALTHFGDGDLPTLGDAIKRRLMQAAAVVDPLRLPNLRRSPAHPRKRRRKSEQ